MTKKLNTTSITNELESSSLFFQSPPPKQELEALSTKPGNPRSREPGKPRTRDLGNQGKQEPEKPRTGELARGEETASTGKVKGNYSIESECTEREEYFLTIEELEELELLQKKFRRSIDRRVPKKEIARLAILLLLEDYKLNGEQATAIKRLKTMNGK